MQTHEIHFTRYKNGHEPSRECWCEPKINIILENEDEQVILVQHADYNHHQRLKVLAKRNVEPGWITKLLNEINTEKEQTDADP